jgi:hypothetical protein
MVERAPGAPRGERNGNYRHGLRTIFGPILPLADDAEPLVREFVNPIAGVSFGNHDGRSRQEIIRRKVKPGMSLVLCPELNNRVDPGAIAALTDRVFFCGTDGSNPAPSASQPSRAAVESDENPASATLFPGLAHEFRDGAGIKFDGP